MGLQFRKSITIAPGVKVNISKSGLSLSTGVKGLHASINTKGQVRGTASLPGTGIRYTKQTKVTNLIPGAKQREEEKKAAEKAEKEAAKAAAKAEKDAAKAAEPRKTSTKKAAPKEAVKAAPEDPKKNELAQAIINIYAIADPYIDWISIRNAPENLGYENWEYLKEKSEGVLNGDVDTYLQIINDVNPFAELIDIGSSFECGTDTPMKMAVECTVNKDEVLGDYKDDRDVLEDYVAGIAIKAARDLFALLPLWQVEVTCTESERTVLNVKFTKDSFEILDFANIDASDTIKALGGIIAV